MKKIEVSAPGKIIIAGEFAVLAEAPAISMAINKRAKASISVHSKNIHVLKTIGFKDRELVFTVNDYGIIEWLDVESNDPIRLFFECLWRQINIIPTAFYKFVLDTSGFYDEATGLKYGIGSSAALTVAMAGVFIETFKLPIGVKELALKTHREFQGAIGSGVDIATSIEGGIIKYFRMEKVRTTTLELPEDLKFKIFWSGMPVSTPKQLSKIKTFSKKSFSDLNRMAIKFASIWECNTNKLFISYLDEYTDALMEFSIEYDLNIFGNKHNILLDLAKKESNLVYKPCGAGGDIGICITSSDRLLDEFEESANQNGFVSLHLELDKTGFNREV
ncbi:MAG: phosphomevalonate kinase [Woeseiaceae bacterium]|jgi:phosphomevalonate kinase|tara:strand:+ start:13795 stop:14793 length:999 start_codon:yes stop_codon:yes gene_type:complete